MVTNTAITIYNGQTDAESRRTKYIPTVIKGVSYAEAKGAKIASNGVWGEDVNFKIRIPMTASIQESRTFIPDLEYAGLDNAEALMHWTIKKGDIIIRGEHPGDGSPLFEDVLNAYAKEHGLTLIHVTEYADNTIGGSPYMKHYRIGGK